MLTQLGDDGQKWGAAFSEVARGKGWTISEDDENWLAGWFANAIEHSWDVRQARAGGEEES